MMSSNSGLSVDVSDGVAWVTLNRPKALNSLNLEMCENFNSYLKPWVLSGEKHGLGAMVVKGSGGKAFCAGGDVKAVWEDCVKGGPDLGTGKPGRFSSDFFRAEYEMNYMLGISDLPQISLWDGIVMGGGVGISVLGEYRIATENTMFAMPETTIGLFPDVGSSSWLPHLPGGLGEYIALTGCRLGAIDLLSVGIATHYVKSSSLDAFEHALSQQVKSPDDSRSIINALLSRHGSVPDSDGKSILIENKSRIDGCFHGKSGIQEILQCVEDLGSRGGSDEAWAQKTLKALSKLSPSSIAISLEMLRRGREIGPGELGTCLTMEYRLVQACMRNPDFSEGVRALLVDKDNTPKWNPGSHAQVSDVESWFSSLGEHDLTLPPQ
jgi:enoyl-CoA hydratase/carnithine racemase